MNDIGALMEAYTVLQENCDSPVQRLRKEIDIMRSEISWHENKYPGSDTTKRRQRLQRLDLICKSLESCEPVSLMSLIRDKLKEARRHEFDPDCACIWLPLSPSVADLLHAKPAIIDLIGWDISTPYDYDHVGMANAGGFICSDIDEEGGIYGN
ncbi:hypothetical protein [Parabacteroides distasonis]|uniref:hypothetical protein n=2 Tax=Parabacteroides distasonis TaxID=823 RepID=UPI000EFFDC9B|nr:hypothetical protein [Parabacteroides distasonis]RHL78245.1 hypothetical protein DW002_11105 [Parabacteroides distasonis]